MARWDSKQADTKRTAIFQQLARWDSKQAENQDGSYFPADDQLI